MQSAEHLDASLRHLSQRRARRSNSWVVPRYSPDQTASQSSRRRKVAKRGRTRTTGTEVEMIALPKHWFSEPLQTQAADHQGQGSGGDILRPDEATRDGLHSRLRVDRRGEDATHADCREAELHPLQVHVREAVSAGPDLAPGGGAPKHLRF
ncbi:hypothetical protein AB1Y20_012427 [Prymnesium parvum]|uniref:Uncharacterized protein n=1 Tax=Prymnesium parvum TaxID=97485 RepID=A0AB34III1_PRYPA